MDKQERDEIRARCEAATGLWRAFDEYRPRILIDSLNRIAIECTHFNDAEFIAAARTDIPALLDALDVLEAERDKYKERIRLLERALNERSGCGLCIFCNPTDAPYCHEYENPKSIIYEDEDGVFVNENDHGCRAWQLDESKLTEFGGDNAKM